MSISGSNGNKRAWLGFSARSRCEATAITIGHEHEAFPRNFAPDAVDLSRSDGLGADIRREGRRAVREIGARVCREGISEQNQSCLKQRNGCGPAEQAYAGVLWLLRLAFLGARTLVARKTAAHLSRRILCRSGARCASKKSYR